MNQLLRTALDSAEAAARVHARYRGRVDPSGAEEKGGRSNFVSRVDLESQEAALEVIRSRHPGHRIMAEEDEEEELGSGGGGASRGDRGSPAPTDVPLWIVDPLDGTTNFLHGHPMYAASVAVAVEGRPSAGAVVAAVGGERWWAARGEGAWKDGQPVRVSGVRRLDRALVGTGFPFKVPDLIPEYLDQLGAVLRTSTGVRRGGAAALDLSYLASGILDAFWELYLNPWDVAAGLMILEEAGGVASRLDGSPIDLARPGPVLAANSREMLEALGRVLRAE